MDELILKIHTILRFHIVFHKVIEEQWIKILSQNKLFLIFLLAYSVFMWFRNYV